MGHWTVFCAITHAPIRGRDRCVGIWTKPNKYDDPYKPDIATSIFYRGVYDTYGRIDFDPNQKFTELVGDREKDGPDMFILESVYDALDSFGVSGFGDGINDGMASSNSDISSYSLKKIGFRRLDERSTDARYKYIYVHDSEPNKQVWSDNTFIRIKLKKGKPKEHVYNWKQFQKLFPSVDYSYLQNTWYELNYLEVEYFKYKSSVESRKQSSDRIKSERNDPINKEALDRYLESLNLVLEQLEKTIAEHLGIDESMLSLLADEQYRKELAKVFRVRSFMNANNIKFGGRFLSGPQEGNAQAFFKLKKLMAIAAKTIK